MPLVALIAAVLGMVLGTAGFVMSLLTYLRDTPVIRVSLNLNMVQGGTVEPFGMIVVTNVGRRPIFITAVLIVPPGVSLKDGIHILIDDSMKGNRLGEGDKPYKCMVNKSVFVQYRTKWRDIRAYAEDSTGKRYFTPVTSKRATVPNWVTASQVN